MSSIFQDPCLRTASQCFYSLILHPTCLNPGLSVLSPRSPHVPGLSSRPFTHVIISGQVALAGLDGKGNEADSSSHPHEALQTACQLPSKLHVLRSAPRWPECIGPIPQQQLSCQARPQALGTGRGSHGGGYRALPSPICFGLPSLPLLFFSPSLPPLLFSFFFSLSTVSLYLSLPLPLSLYFSFSLLSLTSLLLSLSPSLCFSIYTSSLSHVSSPLFPLLLHLPPHPLLSGDSHTFLSPCSSFLSIIPSLCLPTPSSPWWRWSGTSAPAQTLIAGGHSGDDGTRHSLSGSHSPTLPTA